MTRQTSIDAYHRIRDNGLLSLRRWQVYDYLFHNGPCTARVAHKAMSRQGTNSSSFISRFSELRNLGVAAVVGKTIDAETGMTVMVWDATANLPIAFKNPKKEKCPHCRGSGIKQPDDRAERGDMGKIQVTVEGSSRVELVKALRAFADNLDGAPAEKNGAVVDDDDGPQDAVADDDGFVEEKPAVKAKRKKKAAPIEDEEVEAEADEEPEAEAEGDDDDFDTAAKKATPVAKAGKMPKVTFKDVNAACKAYAASLGKGGFEKTKALIHKKFGVESLTDLKPDQWPQVIKTMAV